MSTSVSIGPARLPISKYASGLPTLSLLKLPINYFCKGAPAEKQHDPSQPAAVCLNASQGRI
jgi:hypothetical protein